MGKQKSKNKNTLCSPARRQVLGMLSAGALTPLMNNPVRVLIAGLVDGIIMRSQAQAATNVNLPPRNYVFLGFAGGPLRVHFDNPLTPYTNQAVVANAGIVSRWTNSTAAAYTSTSFTRNGNTLNMPHLWNCSLPVSGGGTVPMASLLDNMLMIRGINNGSDGHALNYFKTTRPVNQSSSIDGAVSERSNMSIPAAALLGANDGAFKAATGVSPSMMPNNDNPLLSILKAFDKSSDGLTSNFLSRQQAMDVAMQSAMKNLSDYAKSRIPGSENLYSMRSTAEKVLQAGIGNVQSAYQGLVQKYRGLVQAVGNSAIPGISDVNVSVSGLPKDSLTIAPNEYVSSSLDMRTMINGKCTVSNLAENFAVAEYLLVNGFTNSINMGMSSAFGLNFLNNGSSGEWGLDEHYGGGMVSMMANSFYWRAVATCIYEFANVLKSKNLWKDTVMHLGGDFGRNPNNRGSGSEHGWMCNSVSIISGAITKPYVVGNTYWNGSPYADRGLYTGTWGASAPTIVDGQAQELTLGHMASTVCSLLRVNSPTPNNNPLFGEQADGTIVPLVELAKNV